MLASTSVVVGSRVTIIMGSNCVNSDVDVDLVVMTGHLYTCTHMYLHMCTYMYSHVMSKCIS